MARGIGGTGDAVCLRVVSSEVPEAGTQAGCRVLGTGTFMLAMPDKSREAACVGCAQEPKTALLPWVTSKCSPPALFEGVCSALDRGSFVERQSISPSSTYICRSGLTCTVSETVLHPHSLLPHWDSLCIVFIPSEPMGSSPKSWPNPSAVSSAQTQFWECRRDLSQSQNLLPTSELFLPTGSEPALPYPSKRGVLPPGYVPPLEFVSVMILSSEDSQKHQGHIFLVGGRTSYRGI